MSLNQHTCRTYRKLDSVTASQLGASLQVSGVLSGSLQVYASVRGLTKVIASICMSLKFSAACCNFQHISASIDKHTEVLAGSLTCFRVFSCIIASVCRSPYVSASVRRSMRSLKDNKHSLPIVHLCCCSNLSFSIWMLDH